LNDYGADISIQDSKFENFGTCGSIIRNYKIMNPIELLDVGGITDTSMYYWRLSRLEYQIFE